MIDYTNLCTACGHIFRTESKATDCPECSFTGVLSFSSDSPHAVDLRRRAAYTDGDES